MLLDLSTLYILQKSSSPCSKGKDECFFVKEINTELRRSEECGHL